MKFWNFENLDNDTVNLRFFGEVTADETWADYMNEEHGEEFITPAGFAEELAKAANKKVINITLNSCGGDAYLGLAIHNALKAVKAKKIITVEGIAASAAATIACAADVLKVYPGSLFMIHNVKSGICDFLEQQDLKKLCRGMEAIEKASAAIYAAKSGLTESNIRALMDKETWYTGAEAVAAGFADELLTADETKNLYQLTKKTAVINGLNLDLEKIKVPGRLLNPAHEKAPITTNKTPTTKKEIESMTLEELKKENPELVSAIENAATSAAIEKERARIAAIEEIAESVNDSALVNAAKFTDVCTAEELALRAFRNAAATGKKFLSARAEELKPAENVTAVEAAPATTENAAREMQEQADRAVIESAIKAVNSIK